MKQHITNIFLMIQLIALYSYLAVSIGPEKATIVPVTMVVVYIFFAGKNLMELWDKAGEADKEN